MGTGKNPLKVTKAWMQQTTQSK